MENPCAASPARGARPPACRAALGAAATEITFYYPIAVGGPITKIIDGYAADFEKANPDIKVKPDLFRHLSGEHRQGADRAKSGKPPRLAVLLSTDMFTLIDEDAIVPIDDFAKTADDADMARRASIRPSWRTARPTARPGACRSSAPPSSSTGTRTRSRRPASTRKKRPANWDEMVAFAKKLTKRDASRQRHPMGREDSLVGLSVLAVPGPDDAERRDADERGRHRDLLRQARGRSRRCSSGSTSRPEHKVHARRASSSGAPRRRISSSARPR